MIWTFRSTPIIWCRLWTTNLGVPIRLALQNMGRARCSSKVCSQELIMRGLQLISTLLLNRLIIENLIMKKIHSIVQMTSILILCSLEDSPKTQTWWKQVIIKTCHLRILSLLYHLLWIHSRISSSSSNQFIIWLGHLMALISSNIREVQFLTKSDSNTAKTHSTPTTSLTFQTSISLITSINLPKRRSW